MRWKDGQQAHVIHWVWLSSDFGVYLILCGCIYAILYIGAMLGSWYQLINITKYEFQHPLDLHSFQ